jgi:hypothetical protein
MGGYWPVSTPGAGFENESSRISYTAPDLDIRR